MFMKGDKVVFRPERRFTDKTVYTVLESEYVTEYECEVVTFVEKPNWIPTRTAAIELRHYRQQLR